MAANALNLPPLPQITLSNGTLLQLPVAPQNVVTAQDRVNASKLQYKARLLHISGSGVTAEEMAAIETYYHTVCCPHNGHNQPAWATQLINTVNQMQQDFQQTQQDIRQVQQTVQRIEHKVDRLDSLSENRSRIPGSNAPLQIVCRADGTDPTVAPDNLPPLQSPADVKALTARELRSYYRFYGGVAPVPQEVEDLRKFIAAKIGCLDLNL